MAILDGRQVEADQIDPAKHRFIGMWRPPQPPASEEDMKVLNQRLRPGCHPHETDCVCGCGFVWSTMDYLGRMREHWQNGCYDEAQYTTI